MKQTSTSLIIISHRKHFLAILPNHHPFPTTALYQERVLQLRRITSGYVCKWRIILPITSPSLLPPRFPSAQVHQGRPCTPLVVPLSHSPSSTLRPRGRAIFGRTADDQTCASNDTAAAPPSSFYVATPPHSYTDGTSLSRFSA